MKNFKIVLIGGASMTWVPKLVGDVLLLDNDISGSEIALMDIDEERLNIMGQVTSRMVKEKNKDLKIKLYSDRRESLKDADIVVSTCLIGGHETWCNDLNIVLKYGIQHPKGMSVGPGGLIQGLKNIPKIVEFAKDMEEICPNAWLLNYTNPMQSISLALANYSKIKSMGLCHGVTEGIEFISEILGIEEEKLSYKAAGINHCGWLLELKRGYADLMPDLRRKLDEIAPSLKARWEGREMVTREMWDTFGAYPLQADIHTVEFFPHYIEKNGRLEDYSLEHNYIEKRLLSRDKLWERVKKVAEGKLPTYAAIGGTANPKDAEEIHADTGHKSHEKIDELINAIIYNKPNTLYINTINNGCISNLPPDCCVEIPAYIDRSGLYGCYLGNLPDGIAGLMNTHAYIQKLTVKSAMEGSRELALEALCLEPMCYSLKIDEIKSMLNELIDSQPEWLPNFFNKDFKQRHN